MPSGARPRFSQPVYGMKFDRRLLLGIVVIGLATLVWLLLTIGLIASTLEPKQRAVVAEQLAPRMALIGLTWLVGLGAIASILRWLFRRYVSAPARLVEQASVLLGAAEAAPIEHRGTRETKALAALIYQLARQRDELRAEVAREVATASQGVQQEKNRLAALMAELTQSVVVCNLDGRILLYNNRARLQFKALSKVPAVAGGAELMGIGRSIYAVFDRQLVAHAMDSIGHRLARGVGNPVAQFVTTTHSGHLLRVQVAPVRMDRTEAPTQELSGFVLMLDNMTHAFEEENRRDQMLHALTQGSRASLAGMSAALASLDRGDLAPDVRAAHRQVIREEINSVTQRMTELERHATQGMRTRWPMEDMIGSDVLLVAQKRIERLSGRKVMLENIDDSVWLRVDSYSLIQALVYLSARLVEELGVKFLRLRLFVEHGMARLDLIWNGPVMSTETAMSWEMDSMQFGGDATSLTVRDVIERHGGELTFVRERVRHESFYRFSLPTLSAVASLEVQESVGQARPEYYDFDLFQTTEESRVLDDSLLGKLSYTVFDTETTGLRPSEGDEIIQIGATRCVNGKLLRHESFEQLVDPGRSIPLAGVPIHGITQEMVRGRPRITEVLPAFHAFAQDTVLVAHNAAFDMKFLQLQEKATGLVFGQPVLDTLLLSAVVHPNQESHRLEAIAARFNVTVLGRHTALGDALVTAEIWLRLIPLLQAMGIRTLRQAREAAQQSYYARLKY